MNNVQLSIPPGLKFVSEEDGKPCHKHMLDGEEVPGCTSVSGLFQDDGWKFAWPVKLMAERLLRVIKNDVKICPDHVIAAKGAWREKRDKSADTGTIAHKVIEEYLNGVAVEVTSKGPEVEHCFNSFLQWQKQYQPEWLATELQVCSVKYRFAGILDALALINGKVTLVDFKTSADIKDDYAIQLAGLALCLAEMGLIVDQLAILHLPKDESESYEFRIIESDLDKNKLAFLVALEFYRHKNLFMARCKSDKRGAKERVVVRAGVVGVQDGVATNKGRGKRGQGRGI